MTQMYKGLPWNLESVNVRWSCWKSQTAVNHAKDFICQGSSAMKVQSEQRISKLQKEERGIVQGGKKV